VNFSQVFVNFCRFCSLVSHGKQESESCRKFMIFSCFSQVVVSSIFDMIPKLMHVCVLSLLFYVMFGIIGIELFGGRFQRCVNDSGFSPTYLRLRNFMSVFQTWRTVNSLFSQNFTVFPPHFYQIFLFDFWNIWIILSQLSLLSILFYFFHFCRLFSNFCQFFVFRYQLLSNSLLFLSILSNFIKFCRFLLDFPIFWFVFFLKSLVQNPK